MLRRVWLLPLVFLLACPKDTPEGTLLSEVRRTLADRERRLNTYHLAGESKEGDAVATHAFFFRAPNKMRGVVMHPAHLEWTWDGAHLAKLEFGSKTFSNFPITLPPEKAAMFLTTTFAPFVSEGFRTPLMPSKGVTATMLKDEVELKVVNPQLRLTYRLRWPTGDFLGKRTESDGQVSELTVDEEQCDEKLKLCVPKVTSQRLDGKLQLSTRLTRIELNVDVPADDFTPRPPQGWTEETHPVVESD